MKLRIRGNSIRLRLRQSEVQKIKDEGIVEEITDFGPTQLRYVLDAREEGPAVAASFHDGLLRVKLPRSVALDWAETEKVSLVGQQGEMSLLVEKDFACLKPRSSPLWEDESDAFPNPNPSCGHPA